MALKLKTPAPKTKAEPAPKAKTPAQKRNPGGRPRLDDDSDTVGLHIRVTSELKKTFVRQCKRKKLVYSEVVRDLVTAWLAAEGMKK